MANVSSTLEESFSSGHLSNFGHLHNVACEKLTRYFGLDEDRDVMLTSSGHTALMSAFATLGSKSVLMPAYTFQSTFSSAAIQDINITLIDSEKDSPVIDFEKVCKIDKSMYDTVVVVCPLSIIPDLQKISEFCKENNKKLIIDGAATFGSESNNCIYSCGDAYCMSFHATKTLSVGECGCVIANKEVIKEVKKYITFGFDGNKVPIMVGINGKVSEYTCAILIDLLSNINPLLTIRADNSNYLRKRLNDYVNIPESFAGITMYQAFPIFLKDKTTRDKVFNELRLNNVEVMSYYKPLKDLENATNLYNRNICIPNHHNVSLQDIDDVCSIILNNV
jgi:dTDP-4-amino-4,6-dideoxygalactose transaminase